MKTLKAKTKLKDGIKIMVFLNTRVKINIITRKII